MARSVIGRWTASLREAVGAETQEHRPVQELTMGQANRALDFLPRSPSSVLRAPDPAPPQRRR